MARNSTHAKIAIECLGTGQTDFASLKDALGNLRGNPGGNVTAIRIDRRSLLVAIKFHQLFAALVIRQCRGTDNQGTLRQQAAFKGLFLERMVVKNVTEVMRNHHANAEANFDFRVGGTMTGDDNRLDVLQGWLTHGLGERLSRLFARVRLAEVHAIACRQDDVIRIRLHKGAFYILGIACITRNDRVAQGLVGVGKLGGSAAKHMEFGDGRIFRKVTKALQSESGGGANDENRFVLLGHDVELF